jgi:hypothetical protein
MRGSATAARSSDSGHAKRPEDWSLEERLVALHESHGLVDESLNAWCRERGLFAHHLAQWGRGLLRRRQGWQSPGERSGDP